MELYHGSNVTVEEPRILQADRKLDFGSGFYLTSSFNQAKRWAELTMKRRQAGEPCVSVYEFDMSCLEKLEVLKFQSADILWLRFVSENRKNQEMENKYDIVIGPVANDKTMPVLNLYFSGAYSEEETIKRLLPQKLQDQYVIKTEKAIHMLKFIGVR